MYKVNNYKDIRYRKKICFFKTGDNPNETGQTGTIIAVLLIGKL